MERKSVVALVFATAAILAMIVSYGAGSVDAMHSSAASGTPVGSSALVSGAATGSTLSTVGTHVGSSVASLANAKLGPRAGAPNAGGASQAANPGCAGNCSMGITDYGLTSALGKYSYKYTFSSSVWDSGTTFGIGVANGGGCLDPDAQSLVCFTLQQNTVLQHMYLSGNHGYYWTQNVPEVAYDASCSSPCVSGTYSVTFLDNIWNFSDSKGICPSGTSNGAGCISAKHIVGNQAGNCVGGTGGAPTFYYCVSATVYDILPPFTITADTNVNFLLGCPAGDNCVNFYGSVQEGPSIVFGQYYDDVEFKMSDGTSAPYYEVQDKNAAYPLPQDFEWVFGGPAGGSGNTVETYGDLQSFYCDASCNTQSNWHSIKNAWSSGSDTAEYVYDVYVIPEFNFRDLADLYFAGDNAQTYIF